MAVRGWLQNGMVTLGVGRLGALGDRMPQGVAVTLRWYCTAF